MTAQDAGSGVTVMPFLSEAREVGAASVRGPHDAALYGRTEQFFVYEARVIPGPLQTPAYRRGLLKYWREALGGPADGVDARSAEADHAALAALALRDDAQFAVILEEDALYQVVCRPQVSASQLGRLLEAAAGNPLIGVIPRGTPRHLIPQCGFWVFHGREDKEAAADDDDARWWQLVTLEVQSMSVTVSGEADTALYMDAWSQLHAMSVTGQGAASLILGAYRYMAGLC